MLPPSQQQQNFRTSHLLNPLSPSFRPRLRKLGREGVSTEQFVAQSSESGFTIVEALLAIIIVSILMVAIAPVLVLATANRVQAKRVELAVNAAKSYIDRVRSDPSLAPPINVNDTPGSSAAQYFAAINPPRPGPLVCDVTDPTTKGYCSTPALTNFRFRLFCVDGDGDNSCTRGSIKDMIVQVAGYQPNPDASITDNVQRAAKGYLLAVRVYRADGFQGSEPFKRSLDSTNSKVLAGTNTGGLGDRKAPLVEMTTQIIGKDATYDDLRQQLEQPTS